MRTQTRSSESGQVLVLVVLAIIVLLGFTALAIDGGMLYSDRRFAQNGADTSSLGGGSAAGQTFGLVVTNSNWATSSPNCTDGNAATAAQAAKDDAIDYATKNGLTITSVVSKADFDNSENVVTTVCGSEAPVPGFQKHYLDVYVKITHETRTSFAHFVFKGNLRNTVEAQTRVYPVQPYGYGNVIVALNPSASCSPVQNGSVFFGGPYLDLYGGGIWSNGCVIAKDPNIDVTVHDGNVNYGSGLNVDEDAFTLLNGSFNPITQTLSLDEFNPPIPDCTGHTVNGSSLKDATGLTGLICVNGDLKIEGSQIIQGDNVTFVMLGGGVTINGGADTNLLAPPIDYVGDAMPGVLFYLPIQYYGSMDGSGCGSPNQEFKVNGDSYNELRGTILAPCSDVQVEGNADNTINGQIIGWNVSFGGTSGSTATYLDNQNGFNPASLDLYR